MVFVAGLAGMEARQMNGQTIILGSERAAKEAARVIIAAPRGSVLTVKPPRRTLDQNAKMHAMLSDISRAKPDGRSLTPDVWKALFLHSMDHSIRFEHALDGQGMVPIGFRSSRLTKEQFSDLIMTIQEYGDRFGVLWSDDGEAA